MAEEKRTQFAMQAVSFAELFQIHVGAHPVEGPVRFRVELAAPDGESTGGGKQAIQHVKLVPEGGGPVTVAGWANQVNRTAEIRTYEQLATAHANRFKGAKIPLDQAQYEALLSRMQTFYAQQGVAVSVAAPSVTQQVKAQPKTSAPLGLIFAILVVIAIVVGAGLFLFLRGRGG